MKDSKSKVDKNYEYFGRIVIDITQDEILESALDPIKREEFNVVAKRISSIKKDDSGDYASEELELSSLSDEELELVERYHRLKELARERINNRRA